MITISISGNTSQDIMKDFRELSLLLNVNEPKQTVVNTPPTPVIATAEVSEPSIVDNTVEKAEPVRRKRRTKAEIDAEKAAKVEALQSVVAANQAVEVPATTVANQAVETPVVETKPAPVEYVMPPIPTTEHTVKIPNSHMPSPPDFMNQPQQPMLNANNAYSLATFKAGLVMIINSLLVSGKLSQGWIAETSAKSFGGFDLWDWNKNETRVSELYESFISWGFINRI